MQSHWQAACDDSATPRAELGAPPLDLCETLAGQKENEDCSLGLYSEYVLRDSLLRIHVNKACFLEFRASSCTLVSMGLSKEHGLMLKLGPAPQ